jgi:hypothetical protein
MSHRFTQTTRIGLLVVALCSVAVAQQTKNFIPVEGANLKTKIDGAIAAGKTNAVNGRFWVAYQFEVRPGVAVDDSLAGQHSGDAGEKRDVHGDRAQQHGKR